eukprot:10994989-Ditylum_brightwellii.AAC.1
MWGQEVRAGQWVWDTTGKPTSPIFASKVVHSKNNISSGCIQYKKAHGLKESLNLAEKATTGNLTKISEINYEKIATSDTDNSIFENNVEVDLFIVKITAHLACFEVVYLFEHFLLLSPNHDGVDESTYN